MRHDVRYPIAFVLLACCSHAVADDSLIPERRRPQFQTEFGYAVFPFPYSLPGIGSGLSVVGGAMNVAGTHMDAYGVAFGGDVKGLALGVADIHLVSERLILEIGAGSISRVQVNNYDKRGMDSDEDEYTVVEISDADSAGAQLVATFFNRRFEVYGARYTFASRLDRVRDRDGNVIIEAENPPKDSGGQSIVGLHIDLTDDYQDPRRGVALEISGWHTPKRGIGSEYWVVDYNATAYLPIGRRSTWAFNVFRSDADVTERGETDPAVVADELGLDCASIDDAAQRELCFNLIDNVVADNTYGTASSLGGFNRLRSYAGGRYQGAHTLFFGTEARWNLTDEFTPFDLYFMRDIRTAIQLSAFYEIGSVAERQSDVGETTRSSYGVGARVVTASGVVFRADVAYGSEGVQPNVFIGYPWEL
jgi:hypothetical protein